MGDLAHHLVEPVLCVHWLKVVYIRGGLTIAAGWSIVGWTVRVAVSYRGCVVELLRLRG